MPNITRWFRVTHDINADPEMWELREKFGDRAGFVWLEMLSIADRNSGLVGPDSEHLYGVLASKCRVYKPKVRAILGWCLGRGWLQVRPIFTPLFGTSSSDIRDGLWIAKWRKYNKTRDGDESLSYPTPTPTPRPTPNKTRNSASPGRLKTDKKDEEDSPMASMNLIPELKAAADAVYYSDPVKFKRIAAWIGQGRKHGWSEEAMAKTLREFKEGHYDLIDEWYPYLDSMLNRIEKDLNRDASDEEHRRHKEEIREASKMFLVK